MKYLILIIAFLAISCNEQSGYKVENCTQNDTPFRRVVHFEYENYKYIFFETYINI